MADRKKKGRASELDVLLGLKLKLLREAAGVTQEKLADSVNITFQQIQKYENGKNRMSAVMLYRLSKSLNVSITDFFESAQESMPFDTALTPESVLTMPRECVQLARAAWQIKNPAKRKTAIKHILPLLKGFQDEPLR